MAASLASRDLVPERGEDDQGHEAPFHDVQQRAYTNSLKHGPGELVVTADDEQRIHPLLAPPRWACTRRTSLMEPPLSLL